MDIKQIRLLAMEWGFKAHEQGSNLNKAKEDFNTLLKGEMVKLMPKKKFNTIKVYPSTKPLENVTITKWKKKYGEGWSLDFRHENSLTSHSLNKVELKALKKSAAKVKLK